MSKIAGVYYNDTTAAPGISLSVYLSGCDFHCAGCHNPQAWDYDYGDELTDELIEELVSHLCDNNINRTLCLLGGEPLAPKNIDAAVKIIDACRGLYPWVEVYIWTGYVMEDLQERRKTEPQVDWILENVDCIIDGPFDITKRDITLPLRGSSNQRINYLKGEPK